MNNAAKHSVLPPLTEQDRQDLLTLLEVYHKANGPFLGVQSLEYIEPHRHKEMPEPKRISTKYRTSSFGDMTTEISIRRQTANVYFIPALVQNSFGPPSRNAVIAMRAKVFDADADKPFTPIAGIEPTFVVETCRQGDTQNLQVHYVFDRPTNVAEFEVLEELAHRKCGGDPGAKGVTQPYRLPGTYNHPSHKKIAAGRSPAPQVVRIVGGTGKRVAVEAFRKALEAMPDLLPASAPVGSGKAPQTTGGQGASAEEALRRLNERDPEIIGLMHTEGEPDASGAYDRSRHCAYVIMRMFEAGLEQEEALAVSHGAPFAAKFEDRRRRGGLEKEVARLFKVWSVKQAAEQSARGSFQARAERVQAGAGGEDRGAASEAEEADVAEAPASDIGNQDRPPLPKNFRYASDGKLQYLKGVDKETGVASWVWFCSPLEILAVTRDASGKGWGFLVRIQTPDYQWHRVAISYSSINSQGDDLFSFLADHGLRFLMYSKPKLRDADSRL